MAKHRAGVPLGLEHIIVRCLEKDRMRRYPTVGALAADLLPFGPKSSRVSLERISAIMRDRGLPASELPPSDRMDQRVVGASTEVSWGRTAVTTLMRRKTLFLFTTAAVGLAVLVAYSLTMRGGGQAAQAEAPNSPVATPATRSEAPSSSAVTSVTPPKAPATLPQQSPAVSVLVPDPSVRAPLLTPAEVAKAPLPTPKRHTQPTSTPAKASAATKPPPAPSSEAFPTPAAPAAPVAPAGPTPKKRDVFDYR